MERKDPKHGGGHGAEGAVAARPTENGASRHHVEQGGGDLGVRGPKSWTFFSTAEFGRANKVPQERVPAMLLTGVKQEMLAGVCTALGIAQGELPRVVHQQSAARAALPLRTPLDTLHLRCPGACGNVRGLAHRPLRGSCCRQWDGLLPAK